MNRLNFAHGEWYHCYTRGVDKRKTFLNVGDYNRFQELLFLLNSDKVIHRSDLLNIKHKDIFNVSRGKQIVKIGFYALMPNHFHIVLQENCEGGIPLFMRKLGIAYAMYFNIKNDRVGNLFVKPFRSSHIDRDSYLRNLFAYVHLNPVELIENSWKEALIKNRGKSEKFLSTFVFSSFVDFQDKNKRPEYAILDEETVDFMQEYFLPMSQLIKNALEYKSEHPMSR